MGVVPSQMRRAVMTESTAAQLATHARTMAHVLLTSSGESIAETIITAQMGIPVARQMVVYNTDAVLCRMPCAV